MSLEPAIAAIALTSSYDDVVMIEIVEALGWVKGTLYLMAFADTVGQAGTSSSEENASGQPVSTRLSCKGKTGKRAG